MSELHYFDQILQIQKKIPDLAENGALDKFFHELKTIEHYEFLPEADVIMQSVYERLKHGDVASYEGFYRTTMEMYAGRKNAPRFGEKTPANVRYIGQLLNIFPNAKIIHIIRDPRAVAASALKMPGAFNGVLIHAISWKLDVTQGCRFSTHHHNYLETRYEHLVTDPKRELMRICEFIEESYSEKMLQFHHHAERYIENEPWKNGTKKPVNKHSLEKWRRVLKPGQIGLVERLTCSLFDDLDLYSTQTSSKWLATLQKESIMYILHRLARRIRKNREKENGSPRIYSESRKLNFLLLKEIFSDLYSRNSVKL